MADNYLEKRMEEYRSGRLAVKNRTTHSMRAPRKGNELVLAYEPMVVVMMAYELTPLLAATVSAFMNVGCRVAFTASDVRASSALAQNTGSRYYPQSVPCAGILADVASRWGDVEVVVEFDRQSGLSNPIVEGPVRIIDAGKFASAVPAGVRADRLARHILYLAHPDNAFLLD